MGPCSKAMLRTLLWFWDVGEATFHQVRPVLFLRAQGHQRQKCLPWVKMFPVISAFLEMPYKHHLFEQHPWVLCNTEEEATVHSKTQSLFYRDTQRKFWPKRRSRKMSGSCKSICMHSLVRKRKLGNSIRSSLRFSCQEIRPKLGTALE